MFPQLTDANHKITSPITSRYNCIAWAAGVATRRWDPHKSYYWPKGISRDAKVQTLVMVFQQLGFEECDSANLEPEFEKIAIYGNSGEFEHAARQRRDGMWTSKLGGLQDIDHTTLESMSGGSYGDVVRIMRRPWPAPKRKRKR